MFESVNGQHSTRWYWQSLCLFCLCVCSSIGCLISGCWLYTLPISFCLRFFCSHYTFSGLVLTDTREKYDGTRRSPWNEIECGDHYIRPMAAFTFFEFASGQVRSTSLSVALNYDIDIQCLCCKLLLVCVGVLCAPLMERAAVKQWLWDNERGLINVLTLQRGHLQGKHMRFEF